MVKVATYFGMTLGAFLFWETMDKVHVWIALRQDEKVRLSSEVRWFSPTAIPFCSVIDVHSWVVIEPSLSEQGVVRARLVYFLPCLSWAHCLVIKEQLEQFAVESGLDVNPHKSLLFIAGVTEVRKNILVQIMSVQLGIMPIQYLGVPFSAQKLGIKAYDGLINKITQLISPPGMPNI
ncbi:hypothetical protein AKJ16_DCAP21328 [Drosera capensis]